MEEQGGGGLPMAAGTTGVGPSLALGFRAPPTRCYGGMSDLYVLVEVTPRYSGRSNSRCCCVLNTDLLGEGKIKGAQCLDANDVL